MEKHPPEEFPKQGMVRQFYGDIFGWSWAAFDEEIKGWVIYHKNPEIPPRIITRRDRIDRVLEGTVEPEVPGLNIGVFEVENVERCKAVVLKHTGKIMLEGRVDSTGLSNFALCADDLGYHFTLVQLQDTSFSSSEVKKILEEPQGE